MMINHNLPAFIIFQGYSDCNCIDPKINGTRIEAKYITSSPMPEVTVQVVPGLCDRECKSMIPFLVGALLILLLSFISAIPSKMVVMRSAAILNANT